MLIVVHDGNIHLLAQHRLDLKTFRRFNIFQVNPAESGCNRFHSGDNFFGCFGVNFNIKDINIGKAFEVDLFEGVQRRFTNAVVKLSFDVR